MNSYTPIPCYAGWTNSIQEYRSYCDCSCNSVTVALAIAIAAVTPQKQQEYRCYCRCNSNSVAVALAIAIATVLAIAIATVPPHKQGGATVSVWRESAYKNTAKGETKAY